MGQGKANQVVDCIRKASEDARTRLVDVTLLDTTIPHEVLSRYDGAKVLLRPAAKLCVEKALKFLPKLMEAIAALVWV